MRAAVYSSVLYGEDFVAESLASVLPHVDLAFVVMMRRPWGGADGVRYEDEWVPWPARFDQTRERVADVGGACVVVIESEKFSPWNRWHHALTEVSRAGHSPSEVVFLDPDCVFTERAAASAFSQWATHDEWTWAAPPQVELWRTPAFRVDQRRAMVSFHRGDLSLLQSPDPPDGRPRVPPVTHAMADDSAVHNLGFCVSESTMRWKHLCALSFSPAVGESPPDPRWLKDKWLSWHPTANNKNLGVSVGFSASIPSATPYDVGLLPASIKKRYDSGEWPRW